MIPYIRFYFFSTWSWNIIPYLFFRFFLDLKLEKYSLFTILLFRDLKLENYSVFTFFYFFSTWSWKIIPYLRFYFFSTWSWKIIPHFDDLVQDCSNSGELAMELLQSFTKPSIYFFLLFLNYFFTFSRPEVGKLFRIYVFTFLDLKLENYSIFRWLNMK